MYVYILGVSTYFKYYWLLLYIVELIEVKKMLVKFDLQHWCCGPKGCELEVAYGEMIDAED